jgi:hypothetical protein
VGDKGRPTSTACGPLLAILIIILLTPILTVTIIVTATLLVIVVTIFTTGVDGSARGGAGSGVHRTTEAARPPERCKQDKKLGYYQKLEI